MKYMESGDYIRFLKPPACSDDEQYNIVVSEDGQDYAIWADLPYADGYWCIDKSDNSGIVKNNLTPSTESPVCPEDSSTYTVRNKNENVLCNYDSNSNDNIILDIFYYFIIPLLIFTIYKLINKHEKL